MFDTLIIDWGSKRTGLAYLSSSLGVVIPFEKECHSNTIFKTIEEIIIKKNITRIVIGRPTNFSWQDTNISHETDKFSEELSNLYPSIKIIRVNENSSSKFATDMGLKNKHSINHAAAVKIGEYYLNSLQ